MAAVRQRRESRHAGEVRVGSKADIAEHLSRNAFALAMHQGGGGWDWVNLFM
jgi:hypothetical protein